MNRFVLMACAAVSLYLASAAHAASPFDALVESTAPITLAANAPVTKLPAGGLFGSLLGPSTPTAECTCENCTCANCGCSVETASEEEIVAAARAADQQRYIYTVAADGSFTAVPRRTATTTRTTTTYAPAVVRSQAVYTSGACADGSCAIPSSEYSGYSYSSQSRSYSGSTPYYNGTAYTGRGSYGGPFRRLFGGGGRFRSCGPNGCN